MRDRSTNLYGVDRLGASLRALAIALAMATLAGACDDDDDPGFDGDGDVDERPGVDAGTFADLTNAQIAGVVMALNQAEIAQGQLALTRAENEDVVSFANQMIDEHDEALRDFNELLVERGVTPVETDEALLMAGQNRVAMERMSLLTGPAFDLAYIQMQVEMLSETLRLIELQLIPSADDIYIRESLESLQDLVEDQLSTARQIREELTFDDDADIDEDLDEATEEALEAERDADRDVDEDFDEATEEALEASL